MSRCQHGCCRDSVIRDMVTFQLAASDASRSLLLLVQETRERGGSEEQISKFHAIHADLVRAEAEYYNITVNLRR